MRYLRDAESIPYPGIRTLILQRLTEMDTDEPYDQFGGLILVEPGDTAASLEAECGCPITTDLFGDAKFGDPDFMPCFEWLEHHADGRCYEMLFVMTDDGNGTALFVPDEPDIDPDLLDFCRTYATPAIAN
ncbi:MAG: hypothetical protein AB1593_03965 [Pseudomonadota bacterium]